MKKVFIAAFLLMLGFAIQVRAVSTNANQGNKTGNEVKTNEQNQIMNQGEETQIQTQEENTIQTQDGVIGKNNKEKSSSYLKEQRRSQVANAVQAILQIADRNGGIGQQVRIIAQNQNQNQEILEKNIEKVQSRSGLAKFFIGPNYGEIKNTQNILEQNREKIRQLNQIRIQLSNESDQQQLTEQIRILEQTNQEIEALLAGAQKGFSLFGWLNKIIS